MINRILNALEVTPDDLRNGVESPAEAALTGLVWLAGLCTLIGLALLGAP